MPCWRILAASVLLAGCAGAQPQPRAEPTPVTTMNPVCSTPAQCKIMWLRAHQVVEELTGMPVRKLSDDRMQTDPPARAGLLGATVTRHPWSNDLHELRVRFECYPGDTGCRDLRNRATNAFNEAVTAASADVR